MATAALIPSDEQIQKDVLAELKWGAPVRPNEIGVAVKDGVVTLADIGDAAVLALEWDAFVIRGLLLELDITRRNGRCHGGDPEDSSEERSLLTAC